MAGMDLKAIGVPHGAMPYGDFNRMFRSAA